MGPPRCFGLSEANQSEWHDQLDPDLQGIHPIGQLSPWGRKYPQDNEPEVLQSRLFLPYL